MAELGDFPSTSKSQKLMNSAFCRDCGSIAFPEKGFCEKCSTLYCTDCLEKHNAAMSEKYDLSVENMCMTHNLELNLFCEAYQCNMFLCQECATSHSNYHRNYIMQCHDKSEQCLAEVLDSQQINEENMKELSDSMSLLISKKASFEKEFNSKQSELKHIRAKLIKELKKIFKRQKNEFSKFREAFLHEIEEEFEELKVRKTNLGNFMKSDYHFPQNESKIKTIKLYQNRRQHATFGSKTYLTHLKKYKMTRSTRTPIIIRDYILNISGTLNFYINGSVFPNSDNTCAISTVYKMGQRLVRDVCFDYRQRNLYVLIMSETLAILKISGNKIEDGWPFPEVGDIALHPKIALLPDRSILLLNNRKLMVVRKDMTCNFSPIFGELSFVSAICSSPCVAQTFIYCFRNDGHNYFIKYKSPSDYKYIQFDLDEQPETMKVHENKDLIAYIPCNNSTIYFCSLSRKNTLYVFRQDAQTFSSGFFISDTSFIVIVNKSFLLIFNFENQETIRSIAGNGKTNFSSLQSITKCNSNTIFVCDLDHELYQIYKMVF